MKTKFSGFMCTEADRDSEDRSITGQCLYIHMNVFRAVFNRVSKVIRVWFGRFKLLFQAKTPFHFLSPRFPVLITGDKYLLRALIGS